jgi:hypothetical protein
MSPGMTTSQPKSDPFPHGKPNHDLLQNLSFMYQANVYLNGLGLRPVQSQKAEAGPSRLESEGKNQGSHPGNSKSVNREQVSLGAIARRANRGYEYAAEHSMLKT